eukprot:gnl/MRDRNA2_/MRDRNA2_83528_c1_seq2.p1 gnl/MRDRNA2_/MRDRNA2_83528_c1~~gnl/MRDRNA2_/MRDRNA2_83528_c1_seq2.p1  ORF type:complete len:531 (-),score=84.69 gnl/MRDRNA2_/MRDRNA2_83528_c1_seq2:97-1569(-)
MECISSHIMVLVTDGWTNVALTAMEKTGYNWFWSMYFLFFLSILRFVLLSLIQGAIIENVVAQAQGEAQRDAYTDFQSHQQLLTDIFDFATSQNREQRLSHTDLLQLFRDPKTREVFELCNMTLDLDPEQLIALFDRNFHGSVDIGDFWSGCIRLEAATRSFACFEMHCDAVTGLQRVNHGCEKVLEAFTPKADVDDWTAAAEFAAQLHLRPDVLMKTGGVVTYNDGLREQYIGALKSDCAHGQGILNFVDGSVYRGQFHEGASHGKGSLHWPDGASYVGQFTNDKAHGKGSLRREDGSVYVGDFEQDDMSGQGHLTWIDGSAYVGQFVRNERDGSGIMTWRAGYWRKYEGQWLKGQPHGQGCLTNQFGRRFQARFRAGILLQWDQQHSKEDLQGDVDCKAGAGLHPFLDVFHEDLDVKDLDAITECLSIEAIQRLASDGRGCKGPERAARLLSRMLDGCLASKIVSASKEIQNAKTPTTTDEAMRCILT